MAFLACLLFIVGVSVYDTYLVLINRDAILFDERNPICEILIRQDPNNLTWFIVGKLAGNLGVVGTLLCLRWMGYQRILIVTIGVALFQFLLLTFLTFSDPMTGLLHFDGLYSRNPAIVAQAQTSVFLHSLALGGLLVTGTITGIRWKTIRNAPCSEPVTA